METSRSDNNTTIPLSTTARHSFVTETTPADTFLIDDKTHFVLQLIFFVVLSCAFGMFGTVTNVINIIVFIRQGLFSGGSTLNLFFLSIADLGVVFTNFLQSIGFAVIAAEIPDLSWDPFDVVYLAIGWPHTIFIVINRILTAYVAFERCMCVVVPFKVQRMFTPRRSLVYILVIFTYSFVSHLPIFLTHGLDYKDQRGTNSTKLVLTFGPNRDMWHEIVYYANFFVISFLSVIIVIVCSVITSTQVTKLEARRKSPTCNIAVSTIETPNNNIQTIHHSNTAGEDATKQSTESIERQRNKKEIKPSKRKEKKLVKMIITISIIFLVCYLPEFVFVLLRTVDERIRFNGQYHRLADLMYSITFVVATVNSGFNIFVYYNMSSRYKKEFMDCFRRKQLGENNE